MSGRIAGLIVALVLVGAVMAVSQQEAAAQNGGCGPLTLDQLFPDLDVYGQPTTTTTTATTPPSSEVDTTVEGSTTTTVDGTTTTTDTTSTSESEEAKPEPCRTWIYEMGFPLASQTKFTSSFGADRDGGARRHEGADLIAPRMTPVLAVADGVIAAIHKTPPDDCCWALITHDDGWQSLYVHLNNDLYLSDDGNGHGVRTDLDVGDRVESGDVIGWVGDSGNAEGTVPHLHFELRHPERYSVDPYPSLRAAQKETELPVFFGAYLDDVDSALPNAERLVSAGGHWPCDDQGLELCPNRLAQPEDTADLLSRLFGLDFPVINASYQTISLQRLIDERALTQVTGCTAPETCLQSGITAGDVARLVEWAYRVKSLPPEEAHPETLPPSGEREAEINLRFMRVIAVCDPGLDTDRLVTRADIVDLITPWMVDRFHTRCRQDSDLDV